MWVRFGDALACAASRIERPITLLAGWSQTLLAAGALAYFVVTVYQQGTSTWKEPMTEFSQVFETELKYPDIFMCMPAAYVATYVKKDTDVSPSTEREYYVGAGFDYASFMGAVSCGANYTSSFIKVNIEDSSLSPGDGCVTENVKPPIGPLPSSYMQLGCLRQTDYPRESGYECTDNLGEWIWDEGARKQTWVWANTTKTAISSPEMTPEMARLARLQPNISREGTEYVPLCFKNTMKPGASQLYDEHKKYFLMQQHLIAAQADPNGPYFVSYLAEQGTAPFHCTDDADESTCTINSTVVHFSGFPTLSIAFLSVEYVRPRPCIASGCIPASSRVKEPCVPRASIMPHARHNPDRAHATSDAPSHASKHQSLLLLRSRICERTQTSPGSPTSRSATSAPSIVTICGRSSFSTQMSPAGSSTTKNRSLALCSTISWSATSPSGMTHPTSLCLPQKKYELVHTSVDHCLLHPRACLPTAKMHMRYRPTGLRFWLQVQDIGRGLW